MQFTPEVLRAIVNTPRGAVSLCYLGFVAFLVFWCLTHQ